VALQAKGQDDGMFKGEALGLRAMYGACRPACSAPCNAQLQQLMTPSANFAVGERGLPSALIAPEAHRHAHAEDTPGLLLWRPVVQPGGRHVHHHGAPRLQQRQRPGGAGPTARPHAPGRRKGELHLPMGR
jgi:hypothetical protein